MALEAGKRRAETLGDDYLELARGGVESYHAHLASYAADHFLASGNIAKARAALDLIRSKHDHSLDELEVLAKHLEAVPGILREVSASEPLRTVLSDALKEHERQSDNDRTLGAISASMDYADFSRRGREILDKFRERPLGPQQAKKAEENERQAAYAESKIYPVFQEAGGRLSPKDQQAIRRSLESIAVRHGVPEKDLELLDEALAIRSSSMLQALALAGLHKREAK